jgi:hypothetical protein
MIFPSFKEYLGLLPADLIFEKFLDGVERRRKILSSALLHDAARRFSADQSLRAAFGKLSPDARLMCAAVYLAGERGVPAPVLRGFSDELLSSFLVFAGATGQGTASYFRFEEFEPKLADLCARTLAKACETPGPDSCTTSLPWHCLADVVICANLALAGRLPKTKKGELARTAETGLRRLLHAIRDFSGEEDRIADPRAACIALLLSYGTERGLLVESEDSYSALHPAVAEWLLRPLESRYADFCEFAFAKSFLWRRPVMEGMFEGPGQPWLSTAGFPAAAREGAAACAAVLWYCGYLDVCRRTPGVVFTAAPRREVSLLVAALPANRVTLLPDFSAVLSQEALPEELYWFARVGDISSLDRVYKGTIRRDIINNSLSDGIDGGELVDRLASWRAPHNIVETVREWIREFSRVHVTSRACVVSFDERASRQILSYEPLKKLVTPARPHSIFSIQRGGEAEVRRLLTEMGFDPREPGGTAAEVRAAAEDLFPEEPQRMAPVVSFEPDGATPDRPVKAGKYGERLKALDMGDLLHVLDYAVLMGQTATIVYLGSPRVKAGTYSVRPLSVHKAQEPFVEAETVPAKTRKTFVVRKIEKIGVGAP